VEDLREGYMQALTMVEHNGNVFWPPIVKYRGNCEIKIKYFPYDDQVTVYLISSHRFGCWMVFV